MSPASEAVAAPRSLLLGASVAAGWAFVALAALSLLVRVSVQDRYFLTEALFYFSQPATMLTAVAWTTWRWGRRDRRVRWLGGAFMLLCLAWWGVRACALRPAYASESSDRLVTWNVARGRLGWDAIAQRLLRLAPDVFVLVEAEYRRDGPRPALSRRLPDHTVVMGVGGVLVGARGAVELVETGWLEPAGRFLLCDVQITGRGVRLLAVDVPSSFLESRRGPLQDIAERVAREGDRPLIIAGDFNTPTDSVLLRNLRLRATNAFEVSGSGYFPTWPNPLPVLAIDQVWGAGGVRFASCRAAWTLLSDHRPVIAEFIVPPAARGVSAEGPP